MANPAWVKGMKSPNPKGQPSFKNPATTNRGRIERLLKGFYTHKRMERILSELSAWEQARFYLEAQAYVTPKLQATAMKVEGSIEHFTDDQLAATQQMIIDAATTKALENLKQSETIKIEL
ncbi:hypothetical protein [Pollutibacter soli]|uniref:hypothetical protein n=1 Tax=Pollutibacter soli TaxID=3034157 RepID=UPI003013ECA0